MLCAVRSAALRHQGPTRRRVGFAVHAHSVNTRASSSSSLLQATATSTSQQSRRGVSGRIVVGLVSLGAGDFARQLLADKQPFDARRLGVSASIGGLYIPLRERFGVLASSLVRSQTLVGTCKRLGLQLVVVGPVSLACFLAAHTAVKDDHSADVAARIQTKLAHDLWPAYKTSTSLSMLVLGSFYLPIPFLKELAVVGACLSWSSYMSYIAHNEVASEPGLVEWIAVDGAARDAA
ncbi:hypothetical protein H310_10546 [Aphanomyces invadans]|uniref:Protein Mpv17 n=1 Tax=Aphanomyces invadans TaxID=157072 RepID=A0A024TQX4_9STRA|nr:hypothetical protein H310_10546 [Aphanomyces invadans]ETV96393.1 hypothetical protein H310_10546 [Aphanomyces invadans]|eukprot:XP_008875185.1 hypothetical protein H310_10546 [Aphanomyces invadans]